jgi:hypothetical protein
MSHVRKRRKKQTNKQKTHISFIDYSIAGLGLEIIIYKKEISSPFFVICFCFFPGGDFEYEILFSQYENFI